MVTHENFYLSLKFVQALNLNVGSILLRPAEFYSSHDIEVILGKEVSGMEWGHMVLSW